LQSNVTGEEAGSNDHRHYMTRRLENAMSESATLLSSHASFSRPPRRLGSALAQFVRPRSPKTDSTDTTPQPFRFKEDEELLVPDLLF